MVIMLMSKLVRGSKKENGPAREAGPFVFE
jgi:hypothetical protein